MPKLYLIPNILINRAKADSMATSVAQAIRPLRLFFVEGPKSARALLRTLDPDFPLSECVFLPLNEHTQSKEIESHFSQSHDRDMAIISEAGYPCVADPGAELVRLAHGQGVEVVPLVGASSIILALAASGLNGQNFAFNGYLPKDRQERLKKIKTLEQRSAQEGQTQIVMEAPYRNQNLLEDLLSVCDTKTLLCTASDITGPQQMIKTATVTQWRKMAIRLEKVPTVFLLLYIY